MSAAPDKAPWIKWYPSDWRADPGLRMCGFAARGLWADVLALMHEAEPYGHLLVNGRAPNPRQLAAMLGGTAKEIAALLEELEEAGVYSRTEDNVIFSRRMVRDRDKQNRDRENGKRGGNPNLKGGGEPDGNPPDRTGGLTGGDNPQDKARGRAKKPEARSQKLEEPPPTPPAGRVVVDRFIGLRGELWPNESRPTAPITTLEAEARRYLDPGTPESLCLEVIERVMREFVRDGKSAPTSLGFCRLSMETATANHKRAQSSPTLAGVAAADPSFDPEGNRWRFRVQRWLADPKSWLTQWGYEPDDRSTMVPATVLAEFGIRPAQAHAAAAGG